MFLTTHKYCTINRHFLNVCERQFVDRCVCIPVHTWVHVCGDAFFTHATTFLGCGRRGHRVSLGTQNSLIQLDCLDCTPTGVPPVCLPGWNYKHMPQHSGLCIGTKHPDSWFHGKHCPFWTISPAQRWAFLLLFSNNFYFYLIIILLFIK